ncbi:hypothetical protein Tco_1237566 [Tanacetum coccineum]
MLRGFSREDLEDLNKLVKAKYGSTRPVEDLDLILYGDLKIMFEPHVEDHVWKNQDNYSVLDWNLYDSLCPSDVGAAATPPAVDHDVAAVDHDVDVIGAPYRGG